MVTDNVIANAQKRVEQFLLTGPLEWNPELGQPIKTFSANYVHNKAFSFTLHEVADGNFHISVTSYRTEGQPPRRTSLGTDELPLTLQAA